MKVTWNSWNRWIRYASGLAIAFVLLPAEARRDLSPYCVGTAPLKQIELIVGQTEFEPPIVTVMQGDCVELRVVANAGPAHNLMIEDTPISSAGAPILSMDGRVLGRAVRRPAPDRNSPIPELPEGWFAHHERIQMRFQANEPGRYTLRCNAMSMLHSPRHGAMPGAGYGPTGSGPMHDAGMRATILVRPLR